MCIHPINNICLGFSQDSTVYRKENKDDWDMIAGLEWFQFQDKDLVHYPIINQHD